MHLGHEISIIATVLGKGDNPHKTNFTGEARRRLRFTYEMYLRDRISPQLSWSFLKMDLLNISPVTEDRKLNDSIFITQFSSKLQLAPLFKQDGMQPFKF